MDTPRIMETATEGVRSWGADREGSGGFGPQRCPGVGGVGSHFWVCRCASVSPAQLTPPHPVGTKGLKGEPLRPRRGMQAQPGPLGSALLPLQPHTLQLWLQ